METARLFQPGFVLCAMIVALVSPASLANAADKVATAVNEPISADQLEFFETRVRPVLIENCYSCHSAEAGTKLKGGLLLDTRDGVRKGGESGGHAVVPGDPEHSLLIEAIRWNNPALQMPPKQRLSDQQVADLTAWIKMGAPDPREAKPVTGNAPVAPAADAKNFWSFKKPVTHAAPAVKDTTWAKTPIDSFVLAKLEAANLKPAAEADRRTLIRRATFDLTGLPPSEDDIEAFVADTSANAYDKLIDRLLASPAYGERWGRYWLDLARYSDTKGYIYPEREDMNFVHAHGYRDWVIKALNDDLPYDQFLMQQIAADQLLPAGTMAGVGQNPPDAVNQPTLAAMGFLTVGRRFLNVPHDIIDDRIDVLTRTTQALTVSCARCHDHKFDPISTADYYSLYGVFAASRESIVPLTTNVPAAQRTSEYETFQKGIDDRVKKLNETFESLKTGLLDRLRRQAGNYLAAVPEVDKEREELFYLVLDPEDLNPVFTRKWAAFLKTRAAAGFDPVFEPWHAAAQLPKGSSFEAQAPAIFASLLNDPANKLNPLVAKALAEKQPKSIADLAKLYGELLGQSDNAWKELTKTDAAAKVLPDADLESLRLVLYGPTTPIALPTASIDDMSWFFEEKGKVALGKARKEIELWINGSAGAVPHGLILEDKPELPPNPRVLKRGNPTNPGEEVPRQYLEIVAGAQREPFRQGSGRLEMAKMIASRDNALTARVMVNRVWMHHFGDGLVTTPSDFGVRSEPPSHPELLDTLAVWFMDDAGWSLKKLHRMLMLSATYRQSSDDNAAGRQVDPENRLLWHYARQRLDLEAMRDAMLATTGELDPTMGGRPADPFGNRRSIYGKVDRQFLSGMARAFDFANPDLHIPQRATTTIPQQALFFMNSGFVMDRARALMSRPEIAYAYDPAEKVKRLYRTLYQREPTAQQVSEGVQFVADVAELPEPAAPPPVPTMWQYGFGEVDAATGKLKSFTPLPHFDGTAYQGGSTYPDGNLGWAKITATGGHAGDDRAHAVVRRWVAHKDCDVIISGTVAHGETAGDGVRAFVISSREGTLASWTLHNRKADHKIEPVPVKQGDTIDFVIDINGNLNSDMFTWSPVVRTVKIAGVPSEEFDAKKLFAGRPTITAPPLDAWQQYAQVLMQSNEFLFVD